MRVIDTLTAGFNTVTKKLWLATLPMVVDLFLWLGPKVSVAPVIEKMTTSFRQAMDALGSTAADPGLVDMFEAAIDQFQSTIGSTNLLALLSWGRLGMPSIAGIRPIDLKVDRVVQVSEYGQMLLVQVLIMALGLFVACIFLGMLACEVRGEALDLVGLSRRVPLYWLRMLAILVPLGVALFFALFSGFLLGPFGFFVWVLVLWAMLYMSFIPQAITLAEDGPRGAVWHSFTVVRLNFWPSVGLVLLINVITTGLSLVWRLLMVSPVGMLVAILANAYVGTGLTVAAFIFYRERIAEWQGASQQGSA